MNETMAVEKKRILSILSMVFGIISIILSFMPFARVIVVLMAVAAIAIGSVVIGGADKSLIDKSSRGMAITGIVLGSVSVVVLILSAVFFGFMSLRMINGGHMGLLREQLGNQGLKGFRHLK